MSGKGSTPRPMSVPKAEFDERYAKTFSRQIDDPSGYDPREKECPPLLRPDGKPVTEADFPSADDAFRVTLTQSRFAEWPTRDTLPTTDPESTE